MVGRTLARRYGKEAAMCVDPIGDPTARKLSIEEQIKLLAEKYGVEIDDTPQPGVTIVWAGRPWSESWSETEADEAEP